MDNSFRNGLEKLSAALKANIVPNQEYLLQGSVLDTKIPFLIERLRGLCDNINTESETFNDHELCFSLSSERPESLLLLRARRALDFTEMPWQLSYVGQPELGDRSRPTVVRNSINVAVSGNLLEFLSELGCKLEFEYIIKGFMFCKGRMKITVSKIYRMFQGKVIGNIEHLTESHLIELSVLAPSGQNAVAEDMRAFAEQLKPLVQLEKLDYKRLAY